MAKLANITMSQLQDQLDQEKPGWELEWADQRDLLELAQGGLRLPALRTRIIHKLWPMLRAMYRLTPGE